MLRQAREEKGVSQRELGRRLAAHHNFVSSVEMGDRVLNFVEVRAWCLALGISWIEFTREVDALLAQIDDSQPIEPSV
jgi:transcriptional regulator with XRE-family HTH domain